MKDRCGECGQLGDVARYHPYAFCALVKAGQDPERVVREAIPFLFPNKGVRMIRDVVVADGTRGMARGR